jgi:hypothetical protein
MIALHTGGIPETAMVLGPILLIVAFIRIARRNEQLCPPTTTGRPTWATFLTGPIRPRTRRNTRR